MLVWTAGHIDDPALDSGHFITVERWDDVNPDIRLGSFTSFCTREQLEDGWLPFIIKMCEERIRPRKDHRPFYGEGLAGLLKME